MSKIAVFSSAIVLVTLASISVQEDPSSLKSSAYSLLSPGVQKRSSSDVLDVPEWLQDIPEESKVAKYRKRRFLNFPTGSTMQIILSLIFPLAGVGISSNFALVANLKYDLPNTTTIISGRDLSLGYERTDIYSEIESLLDGFGFDGRSCTLRTICEVAEMPMEHGIFGEVINLILSATSGHSNYVEDNNLNDDYATAEYYGRQHGSCHAIYPECPISFTNILSDIIPSFSF